MAKALELNDDALTAPPPVPKAAQAPITGTKLKEPAEKREPLQVRWPSADVKAVKRAALENDQTVSDFMLACFHARMKLE